MREAPISSSSRVMPHPKARRDHLMASFMYDWFLSSRPAPLGLLPNSCRSYVQINNSVVSGDRMGGMECYLFERYVVGLLLEDSLQRMVNGIVPSEEYEPLH